MKSSEPLNPIRRAVGESVASLKKLVGTEDNPDRPENNRILRYENLEERRVLSVNGFEPDLQQDTALVTTEFNDADNGFQQDTITRLRVSVNGEVRTLTPTNNRLELTEGDQVEVIEIGFHSSERSGVFAAEGYVSKIGDLSSASMIDYNDGRFSGGDRDALANGAYGSVSGLANQWVVEAGWDRLTINLMHYDVDSTEVGARFFAQLQVGQPDFELDTDHLDTILDQSITVGDEVTIPAKWLNNLGGNFHNYAEVDIYHASDPETIIWAGASVGNANVANSIVGEFLNTRADDPFSEHWTPETDGEYILKYYVDPEKIVNETNEDNNEYEIRLTVSKLQPIAVDDSFEAGESLDVMQNDVSSRPAETIYAEDFESANLAWATNPNGTDTATSGTWEATDPVGTLWNGVQLQLDAAQGSQALVTGGDDDGTAVFGDVDGGVTSALSESIAVPAAATTELSFKYNFAHLAKSSDDYFRVTVVGEESSQVVLEERGSKKVRAGEWVDFSVDVSEFSGQSIQILVEAADMKSESLVEAGIDDIKVDVAEAPIWVNEITQGEHGTATLNEDGTINYTPDDGFEGEDEFKYTLTDGETVSNEATVTVNVDRKDFDVSDATGSEDTPIELEISTEFEQVRISGVPAGAELNRGESIGNGVYEVNADDLDGLAILPVENSDEDFQLTVTPGDGGEFDEKLSQTINVAVNPVVDGGDLQFTDFGIVTGKSGNLPISGGFFDLDGSESHVITINGLPDFVTLSNGVFDGSAWVLESGDLSGLQVSAEKVADTSDWEPYDKKNVYMAFEVQFAIESFEENGIESTFESGSFELFTIQKKKK